MTIKEALSKLDRLGMPEVEAAYNEAQQSALAILNAADEAVRDFTPEEETQLKEYQDAVTQFKARYAKLEGVAKMRQDIMDLGQGLGSAPKGAGGGQSNGRRQTLGERFIQAKEWQMWLKANSSNGRIPDSAKGLNSPPVNVKSLGLFGKKDLITGLDQTSAGIFVAADDTGIYEPLGRFPLNLRDLVSVRQTGSDTVEFVRQVTAVNAATPVPEANVTTYTGATGEVSGVKPEGSMSFERETTTVKTIAVWIPATKRALSDAAQIRGLIDQELRADLGEELENQVLNGNGIGENLQGLANTPNTLAQPFVDDVLVTTRKAITNLARNGKQAASAWLLSPEDWETIELLTDEEGRFRWGGPIARGVPTLWGVPVAQSFFQPTGGAWLGNWAKAVIWDREEANIAVSDSHSDFFIRNMVAIRAELRAAFGVIRPTAFVEVDMSGT